MIHVQGRLYDDIKCYIDNIKYMNSISYDEKNNTPDYFLSDVVENDGWEAKNVTSFKKTDEYEVTYDVSNVNSNFARRLGLSSNYIHSMKGTRKGIEAILGMFGYEYGKDYTITEYYAKCSNFLSYDDVSCLRAEFDYVNGDENTNFMKGYPVAIIESSTTITDENGNIEDEFPGYTLIPWYDSSEKYEYDF